MKGAAKLRLVEVDHFTGQSQIQNFMLGIKKLGELVEVLASNTTWSAESLRIKLYAICF